MSDAKLSEEDLRILELMREASKSREAIPPSERRLVANPDKFTSPFGVDDAGEPFPVDAATPVSRPDPFDELATKTASALAMLDTVIDRDNPRRQQYSRVGQHLREVYALCSGRTMPSAEQRKAIDLGIATASELPPDERRLARLLVEIARDFQNLR